MNFGKQLKEGLITQNPVLVQVLGMCSTMAITTTLFNGIGMGLSVLVILTCANVVISLLRKVIIVVPLTYLLPYAFGMGTDGVFAAEPVSNVIGGSLCFIVMLITVLPELKQMDREDAKTAK